MRNLFKKSLAFCLVAALALTCFVGTFSVSAATFNATISVDNQTITQGTTSVPVVLNITSSEAGINEALIKVSSTLGTVDSVELVTPDASVASIEYPEGSTDMGAFFLSAKNVADGDTTALGSIAAASIKVTFAVAADVAVGDYTIAIDTEGVKAASAAEDVINFAYTPATITVAEKEPEVVEPVVDSSVLMGRGIVAENKVGIKLTVYDQYVANYSDYTLEMKIGYYDIENTTNPFGFATKTILYKNFADDEEVPEGYVKQNTYAGGQAVYVYYVAAYEYTCPVEVKLHLFDENGTEVAVSQTWTFTVSNRILSSVKDNSSAAVFVDLMNYGAAVQNYFAAKYPESDLADAALPTVGYENFQKWATPDSVASLETIQTINAGVASNGSTAAVGKGLLIEDSNIVRFLVVPAAGQNIADLTLKVVFNDTIYGDKTVEVNGSDLVLDGGRYYYYCRDIALYDTEATVSAELYEGDTLLYTRTYSVESGLYDIKANASEVCKAIEKLTVSLWATLPGLQGK